MLPRLVKFTVSSNNTFSFRLPQIYSVSHADGAETAGTSRGRNAIRSALGEHLERYLFRNLSSVQNRKVDTPNFPLSEQWDWVRIFAQLSARPPGSHEVRDLEAIQVRSLMDGSALYVPKILVSLENLEDHKYFPGADTTGCAVHIDSHKCVDNAFLEFVERQCALSSWFGPWNTTEVLGSNPAIDYWKSCLPNGSVRIFDIGQLFDVPVVLTVFVADGPNIPVQFAAGLGAAWCSDQAITKSLEELYQMFELTQYALENNLAEHSHLLQANKKESGSAWPFLSDGLMSTLSLVEFEKRPQSSRQDTCKRFLNVGVNVSLFHLPLNLCGELYYAAKVFSPDAFLSSVAKQYNNYDNTLARNLGIRASRNNPCILF